MRSVSRIEASSRCSSSALRMMARDRPVSTVVGFAAAARARSANSLAALRDAAEGPEEDEDEEDAGGVDGCCCCSAGRGIGLAAE